MKFSDQGALEWVVFADPAQADGKTTLHLQIHDTGCGMGQTERQALFHLFRQGDASARRRHGGTGLGLALAARLANRMGAELDCLDSQPGRGSVFELRAPMAVMADPSGAPLATAQGSPLVPKPDALKRPPNAQQRAEWDSVRVALIRLLDQWDAEALGIARQHADLIREMLGERYAIFDHALARFDFDKAAACLQNHPFHHEH
ncbi:ATP-binding protein [Arthrospira platensis SPKY1]|nr:ATP-binding protein [Arthrospira platensis SPKY1]